MNRSERRRLARAERSHRQPAGEGPEGGLHEQNMALFQRLLPELHQALKAYQPRSTIVYDESGEPDLEDGGQRLYGAEGAHGLTRKRLDAYWRAPIRIALDIGEAGRLDFHTREFVARVRERAAANGVALGPDHATTRSYFAVALGIGLGFHLDELAERTECQCLILADSDFECFYQSTFVYDWRPIVERFRGERRLEIVISERADEISRHVRTIVDLFNPCGLEGMTWFAPLHNDVLEAAWSDFARTTCESPLGRLGYFKDDYYMVLNSYENLRKGNARVVSGDYGELPCPVFIVGSGPSLDASIEFIKKNRDGAIIIACGSAIDPLFAHGIESDFVVIIEQDARLLQYHEYTQEEHDLSRVCLIAASNIYPPLTGFHDETVFFFRPALACRPLLSQGPAQSLPGSEPFVANTAVAFASRAGFRDIYLFGVDMGARDPEHHHSKTSAYTTKGLSYPDRFEIPVPGNLTETVYTTRMLMVSQRKVEEVIAAESRRVRFHNCSDGALIAGAAQTDPASLSLAPAGDKRALVRRIVGQSPVYAADDFSRMWKKADFQNQCRRFRDRVIALTRRYRITDHAFMTEAAKLLATHDNENAPAMLFRGTIFWCLLYAVYFGLRVDGGDGDRFADLVSEEFAGAVNAMMAQTDTMLEALEAGRGADMVAQQLGNEPSDGIVDPVFAAGD